MIILLSREDLNAAERLREAKDIGCLDFTDAGVTPQLINRADMIVFYDTIASSMYILKSLTVPREHNTIHMLGQRVDEHVRDEANALRLTRKEANDGSA
jgi:hypothetical protein